MRQTHTRLQRQTHPRLQHQKHTRSLQRQTHTRLQRQTHTRLQRQTHPRLQPADIGATRRIVFIDRQILLYIKDDMIHEKSGEAGHFLALGRSMTPCRATASCYIYLQIVMYSPMNITVDVSLHACGMSFPIKTSRYLNKHDTLSQCCFNVRLASKTVA